MSAYNNIKAPAVLPNKIITGGLGLSASDKLNGDLKRIEGLNAIPNKPKPSPILNNPHVKLWSLNSPTHQL